jgi:predicted glutamine amidotransferase
MCRWIAYTGKPIYIDMLVTKPSYSLLAQSLNARMAFRPDGSILATNGDGYGIGWYTEKPEPGLFKGAEPAWSNENLHEICAQTRAHIFMAHIRAASTGASQRSNAHPFKYRNWLFQHNGHIENFEVVRRELQCAIAPELFPLLKGTTDSETFFLLALTHGLMENPKEAIVQTLRFVKDVCARSAAPNELIFSCAMSDGKTLYTLRYSSGERCHSQYYSTHSDCMKEMDEESSAVPRNSVVVVSEPLDPSTELWHEMPPSSFATFRHGEVAIEPLEV